MKFHIISHTHWDREWHKTFQEYRVKLIRFMDDLIETLENDHSHSSFMLDGQTSLLEDYLEVKPEKRQKLKQLIRDRRILVGPWYVQPDEFLPSGESLIRNLLISYKIGLEFGGLMNVGYLPDSFGQSSQMPQILKGFGIDSAIFYRGVTEEDVKSTEFMWQTPDGEEILAIVMPIGYGNAMFLSPDLNKSIEEVEKNIELFKNRATTKHILMMAGSDQCVLKKFLPRICEKLTTYYKNKGRDYHFEISNLEKYIESVKEEAKNLPKLSGEFRKGKISRVHASISGTRLDIKKMNYETEKLYEKYLEPISSLSYMVGATYDDSLINTGWKYILQNHAHDSICCVCKDIVHDEMIMRLEHAKQIANTLLEEKIDYLNNNICFNSSLGKPLVVYNTLPIKRRECVRATVFVKDKVFKLYNSKGEEIPYIIENSELVNLAENRVVFGENQDDYYDKMEIEFIAEIDGYGYKTYYLKEGEEAKQFTASIVRNNVLENDLLKVTINEDGTLSIVDKKTGNKHNNLNIIEESGNAGDEYDYSPPLNDKVFTSKNKMIKYEIIENNFIKGIVRIYYKLKVPKTTDREKRSNELIDICVSSDLILYKEKDYLEIKTQIQNTALNHRIRALFETDLMTEKHYAEQSFGMIERRNLFEETEKSIKEKWQEKYYPIFPQHSYVIVENKDKGLAIFNKGLPQYEIINGNKPTIALTLLSGVGWMGKKDLLYRPGRRSGAFCETPKAQLLGNFMTEYAIYPYKLKEKANVHMKAHKYNEQLKVIMPETYTEEGILSDKLKVLNVESNFICTSAIKKHEISDGLIWRVYNSTNMNQKEAILKFNKNIFNQVELLNLREEKIKWDSRIEIEIDTGPDNADYTKPSGTIKIKDIKPNEIFTFCLKKINRKL
ncbi:glycoside hydrolase family 38 C-terminal domain-containing protein [Caldisalinibacter kiritimatiensis]|uniref:Alpha-mannosidase n=1 Tax=Caldisalinibacter kiritimatiensis TaxID=1304284 RepID=R1AS23_9FIRM|nr:glycoside hydrolase family 38 C-terminal domain-containing protein [Caldisalinibacter kiritimatiensis]EOC99937.1 Alpha-mannosidase [Caldisalinibacter kiritimatiensis]